MKQKFNKEILKTFLFVFPYIVIEFTNYLRIYIKRNKEKLYT